MTTENEKSFQALRLRFVTVVYEIVDDKEWGRTNPLKYEHNGLIAKTVCIGDLAERFNMLEKICEKNDIGIPSEIYDA